MKQYIITDEKLQQLLTRQRKSPLGSGHGSEFLSLADWEIATIVDEVYSRPYNPQAERERVLETMFTERPKTDDILTILKKRYRDEMAILDYIEMIECEVMGLREGKGGEPKC